MLTAPLPAGPRRRRRRADTHTHHPSCFLILYMPNGVELSSQAFSISKSLTGKVRRELSSQTRFRSSRACPGMISISKSLTGKLRRELSSQPPSSPVAHTPGAFSISKSLTGKLRRPEKRPPLGQQRPQSEKRDEFFS